VASSSANNDGGKAAPYFCVTVVVGVMSEEGRRGCEGGTIHCKMLAKDSEGKKRGSVPSLFFTSSAAPARTIR